MQVYKSPFLSFAGNGVIDIQEMTKIVQVNDNHFVHEYFLGEGQSQRSFYIDATLLFAFNLQFSFSQGYQRVLLITPIRAPSLFALSQFTQIAQSFRIRGAAIMATVKTTFQHFFHRQNRLL